MTKDVKLSQETFEKLIARASEIDAEGTQRIDLERARHIARELGITDEAWQAAVLERQAVVSAASEPEMTPDLRSHLFWSIGLAALGWAVGAGMVASPLSDLASGAAIVAGALAYVTWRWNRPVSWTLLRLLVFWVAVPVGIDVAAGELWTDPFWFAGWSMLACSVVALVIPRVIRRLRAGSPPTIAPTT